MAVEQLSDDNYRRELRETELAVVEFQADWCGLCLIFRRKFSALADEYPGVRFFVCGGDGAQELLASVQPEEVPYFGIYVRGRLVDGFSSTCMQTFRAHLDRWKGAAP